MNTSNRWRKIAFFVYSIFIISMFCVTSFMCHTKYFIFPEEPKIDVRHDWNGRNGNFCLYFLMSLFWFHSVIFYLCSVPWIASPYIRHHCMEKVKVNWIKMAWYSKHDFDEKYVLFSILRWNNGLEWSRIGWWTIKTGIECCVVVRKWPLSHLNALIILLIPIMNPSLVY